MAVGVSASQITAQDPPHEPANTGNGAGEGTPQQQTCTQQDINAIAAMERKRGIDRGLCDALRELGIESLEIPVQMKLPIFGALESASKELKR